jgi:hypothetical protein
MARCHRIGQQKQVEVFEFVMNSLKPEEVNRQADVNIRTFQYVYSRMAWDIKQKVVSYLLPADYVELPESARDKMYDMFNRTLNSQLPDQFSLDKYVLYKQNKKREKTDRFLTVHNITV